MSFTPIQASQKCFFTLVRGNSSWNDVIESNTEFIESSGDTIQTKNNQAIPMFAEGSISFDTATDNVAATWAFAWNNTDSQFLWGQFRGWNGGVLVVGDDKALSTNHQSFTYTVKISAGDGVTDYTNGRNNSFSSVILLFPESI